MLTAGQIDALRESVRKITDPITAYLLRDIARRIAEAGELTSTAAYQIWRSQQLGVSQRQLKKELRRLLGLSHQEIRRIFYQSAQSGYGLDVSRFSYVQAVPFEQNASLQQIVSAAAELAQEDFSNLTQTIGFVNPFGKAEPLTQAYITATDFAFKQVITGAASYTEAIRQAARYLADKGVRVIDYESGVHTSLEAAVRRNMLGGLGLMQEQVSQTVHDQLGCDGWEITAHANSAPDHEPIQGKQYSDAAYQALNGSLRRRIGTLNCGHAAFPIILGVNSPQYTPAELEKFRTDNKKGVTINGIHYTGYEATQMQRSIERAIRRQKNRIMVDEATGDKEKLAQDKTRLELLHQRYVKFSEDAGLRTQYERTEVAGFGEKSRSREVLSFAQGNLAREGESFDPDSAKTSLLKRLENSPGLVDNITVLRYYAENTGFHEEKGFAGPVGYDKNPDHDVIVYNTDYPLPSGVDKDGVFIHELAHRADILGYQVAKRPEWTAAIDAVEVQISKYPDALQSYFQSGGKYCNDAFFSDIVSAVSRGKIHTKFSHTPKYWAKAGNREQEIFANMSALDVLIGMNGLPDEIGFEIIYEAFKKIIEEGFM